jgi:hypothetical protein
VVTCFSLARDITQND